VAGPLGAWRNHLVRVGCIRLLVMGQEGGLCRAVEYGVLIWRGATKPFWGVAFALRGARLFGLEEIWGTGQDGGDGLRTVSQGFDL
jgi:hypothetical protein